MAIAGPSRRKILLKYPPPCNSRRFIKVPLGPENTRCTFTARQPKLKLIELAVFVCNLSLASDIHDLLRSSNVDVLKLLKMNLAAPACSAGQTKLECEPMKHHICRRHGKAEVSLHAGTR